MELECDDKLEEDNVLLELEEAEEEDDDDDDEEEDEEEEDDAQQFRIRIALSKAWHPPHDKSLK